MSKKGIQLKDKNGNEVYPNPFPVGAVYMSVDGRDPGSMFGGTWTKIEGRFLWATVNTPKLTGGSGTHSHSPGSLVACYDPKNTWNNQLFRLKETASDWTLSGYIAQSGGWTDGGGASGRGLEIVGSTAETETYPPYFEVYMWYRVS